MPVLPAHRIPRHTRTANLALRLFWASLLAVLLACPPLYAQVDQAALDNTYGFLGLKLETPMDSLPFAVKKTGTFQHKGRWERMEPTTTYLDIDFKSVEFLSYQNRLHSIRLKTDTRADSDKLLETISLFFGPGQREGLSPIYHWKSDKVHILFDRNLLNGKAEVLIRSQVLQRRFELQYRRHIDDWK